MTSIHRVKIISWNVNGLQGIIKKTASPLENMVTVESPDILCLQEIRCSATFQWSHSSYPHIYSHHCDTKAGYSGTLIASKIKPLQVSYGLEGLTNQEGRVITAEFDDFIIVNVYAPNTISGGDRWTFRIDQWEPALRKHLAALQEFKKGVIVCGDLNVIPTDIDMLSSQKMSGASEEERANFFKLLREFNLIDSFRYQHRTERKFSWIGRGSQGTRIDFFLIPSTWVSVMKMADILKYEGSDHRPIVLVLEYTK